MVKMTIEQGCAICGHPYKEHGEWGLKCQHVYKAEFHHPRTALATCDCVAYRLTEDPSELDYNSPIHSWFGLTYASYLTLPRCLMEAMPGEWKARMALLLHEMDEAFDRAPIEGEYAVNVRNEKGRFVYDPLREYRHPDFRLINSLRTKRV